MKFNAANILTINVIMWRCWSMLHKRGQKCQSLTIHGKSFDKQHGRILCICENSYISGISSTQNYIFVFSVIGKYIYFPITLNNSLPRTTKQTSEEFHLLFIWFCRRKASIKKVCFLKRKKMYEKGCSRCWELCSNVDHMLPTPPSSDKYISHIFFQASQTNLSAFFSYPICKLFQIVLQFL